MESTQSLQNQTVSEEVKKAAYRYALSKKVSNGNPAIQGILMIAREDAFIAGASFNQPIEHSAKPENENDSDRH